MLLVQIGAIILAVFVGFILARREYKKIFSGRKRTVSKRT
ncbi:hypothetical protein QFZ87_003119 [Bacillus sp. SLBN-46]|nr:hypothetical protein [Bacillus sp. SLBN-46]